MFSKTLLTRNKLYKDFDYNYYKNKINKNMRFSCSIFVYLQEKIFPMKKKLLLCQKAPKLDLADNIDIFFWALTKLFLQCYHKNKSYNFSKYNNLTRLLFVKDILKCPYLLNSTIFEKKNHFHWGKRVQRNRKIVLANTPPPHLYNSGVQFLKSVK